MSTYTVGDTPTLSYTFLLKESPGEGALCTYSVTDENGALLAGDEPAQVMSIKQLPGGRFRVKVIAAVVIPDTEYDSLTIDFYLKDEETGLDEAGSVEIDVTLDLDEPEEVQVFLFNQDVTLSTVLSFTTEQDANTSHLRLLAPTEHLVPRGRSYKIDIGLSEPYMHDLVLTYTSKALASFLDVPEPNPAYADSIQGTVVIPAWEQRVSLTIPSAKLPVDGDLNSGVADHALLTFKAPEGSGIPDLRTRVGWDLSDGNVPDVMVDFRVRPFAPGDSKLTVSFMVAPSGGSEVIEPFEVALRMCTTHGGSGHEGIDFPSRTYVVTLSELESTVDLPVYVSDYPAGQPYAELVVGLSNDHGTEVQLLADTVVITPTVLEAT